LGKIRILSKDTVDKIAAGEVVTSPASALKEMIENSIDANAKNISVETRGGGKSYMAITDDGDGIEEDDIPLAFTRYATSKIEDSIDEIDTLGFRGEALASIAFVSRVKVTTRAKGSAMGVSCSIIENEVREKISVSCNVGTTIEITDLFYNTPARLKYLKKDYKETSDITEMISCIALSHPEISFRLVCDGKEIFFTDGRGDVLKSARVIYGRDIVDGLMPCSIENDPLSVSGYVSSASFTDDKGKLRLIFINGRYVKSSEITAAIDSLYNELYSKTKPNFILYITLPPRMLDVNIHPAKTEIKLLNSSLICMLIKDGIRKTLSEQFVVNNSAPAVREKLYEAPKYENRVFETVENYIFGSKNKKDVVVSDNSPELYEDKKIPVSEEITSVKKYESDNIITPTDILSVQTTPSEKEEYALGAEKIDHDFFEKLSNMKYIGNAFSQYAMVESHEYIYAIDVHAAHERILYERFLAQYRSQQIQLQPLLIPKIVNLPQKEYIIAVENTGVLCELGFEAEDFGGGNIAIRSIPADFADDDITDVVMRIIEEFSVAGKNDILARNERLIRAACHNAVRGESDISEQQVRNLLKDLAKAEHPYTCPHGRSVVGKLSIKYFMKAFNRI